MIIYAEAITTVEIVIKEGVDPFERVIGPGGDEWRKNGYSDIRTKYDVIQHWCHVAIISGATYASQFDGWADLEPDDVTLTICDVMAP